MSVIAALRGSLKMSQLTQRRAGGGDNNGTEKASCLEASMGRRIRSMKPERECDDLGTKD